MFGKLGKVTLPYSIYLCGKRWIVGYDTVCCVRQTRQGYNTVFVFRGKHLFFTSPWTILSCDPR